MKAAIMFPHKSLLATIILLLFTSTCMFAQTFGTYKNTAVATATASGGVQVSDISNNGGTLNQPSGVQTPINFPMIGLGKVASAPVIQNDGTYNVDYTFTIKNFGQTALQNVQIKDIIKTAFPSPATYTLRAAISIAGGTGLTVNTSFDGTSANQNLLVAASSNLAIGDSRTITVPLNVSLNGSFGTFNNTASASATTTDNTSVFDTSNNSSNPDGNGDGNPFNDSAITPVIFNSPDIQVTTAVNNSMPTAGSNVIFTITAKNNGPGDAANVTVTDLLSSGYTLVSASTTAGSYDAATGVWSIGNIANSLSRTLTITARVLYSKTSAEYQNTASSNYLGDNTPANNSQTISPAPIQVPPDAVNDAITGIPATTSATLNLLTNDKLADGSAATPSTITVDIDQSINGVQTTLLVIGQGTWNYDTTTGNITFTPGTGFTLSPTAITYTLAENATGLNDRATVTVTKAANTDVTLRNLTVSSGTLSPAFTPSVPDYAVTVPYSVSSIGVNATANDVNASIRINSENSTGGSASSTITLNVGTNTVMVSVTAHDGITRQAYTITVTREKAPQTISFTALPVKTYGDADFPLNASSSNATIPVTYVSDNPAVATIVDGNIHIIGTGTVNFTASQQGNATYNAAADVIQTLTVIPAAQTINFTAQAPVIYGDADFSLAATASSRLPVTFSSADATIASVSGTSVTIHKAGTVSITAFQAGDVNYNAATSVVRTLTVNPKTLTASLVGVITKVYDGNTNASFTSANYTLSAKIGTDDVSLNYPATGSYTDRTVNINKQVSVSGLSITGANATNYVLASTTLTANIGTIIPAMVQLALTGTVSKTYDGSTLATLSAANYQLSGVIGNDQVEFNKPTTGSYDNNNMGINKAVTINGISLSGTDDSNYVLATATVTGNVGVITTKNLTITANDQAKTFGAFNPALTISYNGFVNGDSPASLTTPATVSTTATATSAVGTYAITASGAESNNYAISYQSGTLTVGPSSQTITFAALSNKTYGDTDFALAATSSSGLPVTYTSSNASVATVGAGGSVHIVSAGTVTITALQTGNNNYVLATAVPQSLTINKASLRLTAVNQNKVYGESNPALTVNYTGFVNGETAAALTSVPTLGTTATTASGAGTYPITITGATSSNYNITYTAGTLTITKAALSITADNKTRIFGSANPALTVSYSGFVNGDGNNSLATLPAVSTTATTTSAAGTYPITISGAASANYSFVYVPGTLTVTNAAVNSVGLAQVTVLENQASGAIAGTLSATSADPNATHSYTLVSGNGSADNAAFTVQGNKLIATKSFDFEQQAAYSVRLRATNQYGLYLEQSFTVNITDVNEAPTLAAIPAQQICYQPVLKTIRLSGITPGPESSQSTTLKVSTSDFSLFGDLRVSAVSGNSATLSYQLARPGSAVVTVSAIDNGGTANGGMNSFSQSFTVNSNDSPVAQVTSDKGTQISKGETVTLTAAAGNAYSWDTSPNVSGTSSSQVIRVRPYQTTTYQVTVSNASGCSSTKSITINVADDYSMIDAANILTPNGDGKNDTWVVKNLDLYPDNTISIFDKGGRKLLEVKHYNNDWDGTFRGSPLTEGTYYYVIDFGPGKAFKKGFITILRNR